MALIEKHNSHQGINKWRGGRVNLPDGGRTGKQFAVDMF
ncbi:Uncharacterized protein ChrSV_0099 [Chromobacterium vaccinii]|nr:Uncharacterized protein ChrSW_0099 [Chromobacterium vaccinii]QND87558.1 Uncharacterized protein ChrSV_0099 [Chromobacterium vaccinii]